MASNMETGKKEEFTKTYMERKTIKVAKKMKSLKKNVNGEKDAESSEEQEEIGYRANREHYDQ